jgi:hypothetical protein
MVKEPIYLCNKGRCVVFETHGWIRSVPPINGSEFSAGAGDGEKWFVMTVVVR